MPPIRRVIRKYDPTAAAGFDDQLWPVNIALLVLCGCIAGVIVALGDFQTDRLIFNGYVQLVTLAVTMGLLLWGAARLGARGGRRLQLAAILSLMLHLVVGLRMYFLYVQSRPPKEEERDVVVAQEEVLQVTVKDSELEETPPPERVEQLLAPTVTAEPEEAEREPLDRTTPTPLPTEAAEVEMAEPTATVAESATPQREIQEAAPRAGESLSQLSRQMARQALDQPTPVDAPEQQAANQGAAAQAAATPVARQAADSPAPRRAADEPASTVAKAETTTPAHREAAAAPTQSSSSTPQLTRAVAQPTDVPRAPVETPEAVAVTEPTLSLPQPNTTLTKQATASPTQGPAMTEPVSPGPGPEVSLALRQAEATPDVAAPATPGLARTTAAAAASAAGPIDSPSEALAPAESAPAVAAATTEMARSNPGPASPTATQPGEAMLASDAPSAGGPQTSRRDSAQAPSIDPSSDAAQLAQRTQATASVPASPSNIDSPSVAEAASDEPTAEASRLALAKGTTGISGEGATVNFEQGISSTRSPAPTASASARRDAASQTDAPGPQLTSAQPASVPRNVAGGETPSASAEAMDVAVADTPGAENPGAVDATASAAVQKASGSAPPGAITADRGDADIDIGARQVLADVGASRPAGGGQPDVAAGAQAAPLARTSGGGSPISAIASDVIAPVAEAPAGEGGGPAAPAATALTATGRVQPGAGAILQGGGASPEVPAGGGAPGAAQIGRAAATEGAPGAPAAGGSAALARSGGGGAFTAQTQADLPAMASEGSEGPSGGPAVDAPQLAAARQTTGIAGPATTNPGAIAGETAIDAAIGEPGLGSGAPSDSRGAGDGPTVGDAAGGAPLARRGMLTLPSGQAENIEAPAEAGAPAGDAPEGLALAPAGDAVGPLSRRPGAVRVDVAADEGPGGLGDMPSVRLGSPNRTAQANSDTISLSDARFPQRASGAPASINSHIADPTRAFTGRTGDLGGPRGSGQPVSKTEASVELGLAFLARHQSPNGSWRLHAFPGAVQGERGDAGDYQADTAGTGLALLAFLGAGYDHFDDQYQGVVQNGIQFLLKSQTADGLLYINQDSASNKAARYYSHGIATIALCEAYGMTRDESLRIPCERALKIIIDDQHPTLGGWRYSRHDSSDTSVTGWMLMALKSGELAGLTVPDQTYEQVWHWLDLAQVSKTDASQYVYNPQATDSVNSAGQRVSREHLRLPSRAMTAAGLLMRLYMGVDRQNANMRRGADYLKDNLPVEVAGKRDTYYWYYATQVMYHMKGDYWTAWNGALHPLLVGSQIQTGRLAGSWDPRRPVRDQWGPNGGRIYVTALNLLSLEVTYRHLPIYSSTEQLALP